MRVAAWELARSNCCRRDLGKAARSCSRGGSAWRKKASSAYRRWWPSTATIGVRRAVQGRQGGFRAAEPGLGLTGYCATDLGTGFGTSAAASNRRSSQASNGSAVPHGGLPLSSTQSGLSGCQADQAADRVADLLSKRALGTWPRPAAGP